MPSRYFFCVGISCSAKLFRKCLISGCWSGPKQWSLFHRLTLPSLRRFPPRRLRPSPGLPSTVRLLAPSVSSPPLTFRLICPASLPPPLLSRPALLHISPFRPSPLSPSPLATGDFVVIPEMEGRWRSGRWGDRLGCSFGCWCAGH